MSSPHNSLPVWTEQHHTFHMLISANYAHYGLMNWESRGKYQRSPVAVSCSSHLCHTVSEQCNAPAKLWPKHQHTRTDRCLGMLKCFSREPQPKHKKISLAHHFSLMCKSSTIHVLQLHRLKVWVCA